MDTVSEYLSARISQLNFYRDIPLYTKAPNDNYVLYKPPGITLGEMRISEGMHPKELYIKQTDKLSGLQEAQKGFNRQLEHDVMSGNPVKVKETLVAVVQETMAEPRSGSLEGMSDTVGIIVSGYSRESGVIQNLIDLSSKDYSSTLHSINVMAMALNFALHFNFLPEEAKLMGLCGLLHDVGKTRINNEILTAPRKLTNDEFEEMRRHTIYGYNSLRRPLYTSHPEANTLDFAGNNNTKSGFFRHIIILHMPAGLPVSAESTKPLHNIPLKAGSGYGEYELFKALLTSQHRLKSILVYYFNAESHCLFHL